MERSVTVGIIGAGFGQQVHAPAFRLVPQCRLHTICASRLDRAQEAAGRLGIPQATDDWKRLIADPEIQAITLAVPPSLQAGIALAAARAGKHLFCEKPLALDTRQAQEIVEAVRAARIVHAIDFIFPELAAWQKARELIRSARFGRIRHIALTWRVETFGYRPGARARNWKQNAAEGGGTLNNFASHTFHYLEWLFGPIARLSARLSPRESEVEARTDLGLEFTAGFSGSVSIAADAFLGPGHRLEVYGEDSTVVLHNPTADYARGFELFLGDRTSARLERVAVAPDDESSDGRIYPVSRIAARFIDGIVNGTRVSPDLEDGLRAQVLLDAARLADRAGSWQAVCS